jgi:hypothetical protein
MWVYENTPQIRVSFCNLKKEERETPLFVYKKWGQSKQKSNGRGRQAGSLFRSPTPQRTPHRRCYVWVRRKMVSVESASTVALGDRV